MINLITMQEDKDRIIFRIRVQPRASCNQVAGVMGGVVKIRIKAPPVDGRANDVCLKFLAGILGIPVNSIEIISGYTGRNKIVRVTGLTAQEISELINKK